MTKTDHGTAIITGGAKRVGKAIALHLAGLGYDIALHYHRSKADAESVRDEVIALGRACTLHGCDLADPASYANFMAEVMEAHDAPRVLVNNASIFERVAFMDTTEDVFDRHMGINFKAPFFLTQAFTKVATQGCVVNIIDTNITNNHGAYFAYMLSKKVLYDFTRMAAKDLAPGIRVNGICPGTMLESANTSADQVVTKGKNTPLGQAPTPEQLCDTLEYLIHSDYLTGECIFVDSGQKL